MFDVFLYVGIGTFVCRETIDVSSGLSSCSLLSV